MKTKIPNFKFRITNFCQWRGNAVDHSPFAIRHSQLRRGIALVITLILLSVTLIMAVAFLALSRRGRLAATTATDNTTARLAAEASLAAAEAQIAANLLTPGASTYNFGLLVSTNDPAGLNLTQLRPPVYIATNQTPYGYDFRFYLDLNRNGKFEANGWVNETDNTGATNGNVVWATGDPEWIGVLERPDAAHAANNKFLARYAFLAQPIGNSLDLNAIHNYAKRLGTAIMPNGSDSFFRNEGVGSWELNLGAFLSDLNTNQWFGYNYSTTVSGLPNLNVVNSGNSFDDALALLRYRYGTNYNLQASANKYFAIPANYPFNIDGYSDGPVQSTVDFDASSTPDNLATPWAGADNTNRFFALPSDLFDTSKTAIGVVGTNFTQRLQMAGAGNSTYDRYTFYRLLDQLGTDSTTDDGRMNLNYDNLDAVGNVIPGAETNCTPWTNSVKFFTAAANRLLTNSTATWLTTKPNDYVATFNTNGLFGIANIPVLVSNQFVYSPAVNRLLQLAANIYDASTNSPYPSVFRPLFTVVQNGSYRNLYICGYTNVDSFAGPSDLRFSTPFDAAYITSIIASGAVPVNDNIYGVPWIIGAKKGLPNFNEFSMINDLAVTRRLQLTRTTNTFIPIITGTNQMYTMSLNSALGIELWNSYANNYTNPVQIYVNENAMFAITNDDPGYYWSPLTPMTYSSNFSMTANSWSGSGVTPWYAGKPNTASFILPLNVTMSVLTNSVYRSPYAGPSYLPSGPPYFTAPCFVPTNYFDVKRRTPLLFEANSPNGFHLPQFGVVLTNRLQLFMVVSNHVIDYVHFAGPDGGFNVNSYLADKDDQNDWVGVWDTNYPASSGAPKGPTYGIWNQIAISKSGTVPAEDGAWNPDPEAAQVGAANVGNQTAFFKAFFLPGSKYQTVINPQLSMQAPYSPTRYIVQYLSWQANDPLVHYLASDIDAPPPNSGSTTPSLGVSHYNFNPISSTNGLTSLNLGKLNERFMPWGGNSKVAADNNGSPAALAQIDPNLYNPAERDPLVYTSDNWDFPANKYPTPGWLGRVHRGTPWQTVFLKSTNILAGTAGQTTWANWTGNTNGFDAVNSAPVQDFRLFDLFSTALNGNATRGTLSINQAGLAAWSALFSGLVVPTSLTGTYTNIDPAGVAGLTSANLGQLVSGIYNSRANFTNTDGVTGVFEHVGDILNTPALTQQSPFLTGLDPTTGISDELYEWLPQQTIGLLRVGSPRYVVYCYGQALRPAVNSIVTTAGNFGLVTNYQVVAESAARAVIRVDNAGTSKPNVVVESFNVLGPD